MKATMVVMFAAFAAHGALSATIDESRINAILDGLSLEQKIGQLCQTGASGATDAMSTSIRRSSR